MSRDKSWTLTPVCLFRGLGLGFTKVLVRAKKVAVAGLIDTQGSYVQERSSACWIYDV